MKGIERGITLIALVVTIVVLLILAGVSISILTGENGIITQAQEAKEQNIRGREREAITIAFSNCKGNNYLNENSLVTSEQLQKELENNGENCRVSLDGNNLKIFFNETKHRYRISQEGKLEQLEDLTDEIADKVVDLFRINGGVFLITEADYVKFLKKDFPWEQDIIELNIEDAVTISENGVKEKGEDYFIDNTDKIYTWEYTLKSILGNQNDILCINEIVGTDRIIKKDENMVLTQEGKLYIWGENNYGQLGNGEKWDDEEDLVCANDIENSLLKDKVIVDIASGYWSSYAIDSNGELYSWGRNSDGQLGIGSKEDKLLPTCVTKIEKNKLYNKKIKKIESKGDYCIALDENGKVYTWGSNWSGQLGDGTKIDRNEPICISDMENDIKGKYIVDILEINDNAVVDDKGNIYEWDVSGKDIPTQKINEFEGIKIVKKEDGIALDENGKVYTWGGNWSGQLGNGTISEEYTDIPICISDLENDLKGKKIVDVIAGYGYNIALDDSGNIYTWGGNESGELGNNSTEDVYIPKCINNVENSPLKDKNIVSAFTVDFLSSNNTVAIDENGNAYIWGNNESLRLGLGTATTEEIVKLPICINEIGVEGLKDEKIKTMVYAKNDYHFYITESGKVFYSNHSIPI